MPVQTVLHSRWRCVTVTQVSRGLEEEEEKESCALVSAFVFTLREWAALLGSATLIWARTLLYLLSAWFGRSSTHRRRWDHLTCLSPHSKWRQGWSRCEYIRGIKAVCSWWSRTWTKCRSAGDGRSSFSSIKINSVGRKHNFNFSLRGRQSRCRCEHTSIEDF